jgi:hypothetical protein
MSCSLVAQLPAVQAFADRDGAEGLGARSEGCLLVAAASTAFVAAMTIWEFSEGIGTGARARARASYGQQRALTGG